MKKTTQERSSRPPWERMMRIHERIQAGGYPNCVGMAKEMGVSLRTVKRDVEFMTERLKMPIEYDSRKYGFRYTRPVDRFPGLPITEAEVFALLVAHKAIAQYRGTPFEKPLAMAFRKLTGQLDTKEGYSLDSLQEAVSFRPFAPDDADLRRFQIITRAIRERRALGFQYKKLGAANVEARLVHPYHLACIENHWYLFGFDVDRQTIRTFSLSRLTQPELGEARFTMPKDFDPDEYLRGSLSVFKGTDDYEVVIEFDPWATDLVRGRHWHSSQEFAELPGGGSRLRLRLNSIEEIERWVLTWGTHATVVKPRALAERIRKIGEAFMERYSVPPDA
ncbi:MAG TPA: WYL domain-containing protein [Verrucomicrobiota bacterium]|nr:WYL domain-containing protein [Verrucomicrobiota bacterium]